MKKIILTLLLASTTLYSANNLKVLNDGEDSDTAEIEMKGNGESCKLWFASTGEIDKSSCLYMINSKGAKIYCTPKKKMCKTYDEIYAFIFEPQPQSSPSTSHNNPQVGSAVNSQTPTTHIDSNIRNAVNKPYRKELQGNPLPITDNNLNEYIQRLNAASQSISLGDSQIHKAIRVYKEPLEDMGYDFDATIIDTTKILSSLRDFNRLAFKTHEIWNNVVQLVVINPDSSVKEGFVTKKTRDKLLIYNKFGELKEDDILAIKYVLQCQKQYNGLCYASQYAQVLLKNGFISSNTNVKYSENEAANSQIQDILALAKKARKNSGYDTKEVKNEWIIQRLIRKVSSDFWNYIRYADGSQVIDSWFLDGMRHNNEKAFKIIDRKYKELSQYDPWWER